MEKVIILITFVGITSGIQYNGLRVKFGWTDALADVEYFFIIPRTIGEVEGEGWRRTERPPGPLKELRMYCPPERIVCPLYDAGGFIAGLQIAIPAEEWNTPLKPEKKFVKWHAQASEGEPAKDYWTSTQFYVSEESLKAGAGPSVENGGTLQDGGVWIPGHNGKLTRLPISEAELNATDFKKQNCIPNMGTHYYYKMSQNLNCEDILPWFVLTSKGEMVGTSFMTFGTIPKSKFRNWFEHIPNTYRETPLITIPDAPSCLLDWFTKHNLLTMHIYYVNEPWTIRCKDGDSIHPAPPIERLKLSGYRYANQIHDEIMKLFKG